MKAIVLLFLTLMLLPWSSSSAEIVEIIYEKVTDGGQRGWVDSPTLPCILDGATCKITLIEVDPLVSSVSPAEDGGYILTGQIKTILHESVGQTTTLVKSTNGSNWAAEAGEFNIRIQNCSAYPFLNGVVISANGVTTDQSGNFCIFVPVYQ